MQDQSWSPELRLKLRGFIVKRLPLALLAVIVAAACQEIPTSPQATTEAAVLAARVSNPPPPPIDTGAAGSFTPDASAASVRAAAASGGTVGSSAFFTVGVRYFVSPTDNSGYIHFRNDSNNNGSGGSIKVRNGVVSGNGFLTLNLTDGVLRIDLSSVQQPPSFVGCSFVPGDAPTQNGGGVCFSLFFSSATFTPTGGSPIQGSVQLFPSFTVIPCEGSCGPG